MSNSLGMKILNKGFKSEDCFCRQGRHEWKFERRALSNIELMSAEDALEVKADKGCKYENYS